MSAKEIHHYSPSEIIRKRFAKNKPAVFGLYVIIFAHIMALLGYLIMPDSTPNAADGGAVYMKRLAPMETMTILKENKNEPVERVNIFKKMLSGQANEFQNISPVIFYEVNDDSLFYKLYPNPIVRGTPADTIQVFLLDYLKPLYVGSNSIEQFLSVIKKDALLAADTIIYQGIDRGKKGIVRPDTLIYRKIGDRHYYRGDTLVYLDSRGMLQFTSLPRLVKEFKARNVEERTFYLGTDQLGRDVLSRTILGTRISLSIGFVSVLISLVVGITLGAIAGYYGGIVDTIIFWLMTVVWSVPSIMLVIAISLVLGNKGIWVVFVSIGLTTWVDIARVVRGEVMSIKQKLYIESARAFGLSNYTIIYRHILPNLLGSIIVVASSNFASAILMEAGLSFLGIGVELPVPSWGNMLKDGFNEMSPSNWFLVAIPSFCIITLVLSFNLLGNGLRDAYDPKENMS